MDMCQREELIANPLPRVPGYLVIAILRQRFLCRCLAVEVIGVDAPLRNLVLKGMYLMAVPSVP